MRVLIRVDASSTIGTGHLMRCLALADSLQKLGGDITFLCKAFPSNGSKFIELRGFTVILLPLNWKCKEHKTTHRYDERMLRRHSNADASQTQKVIKSIGKIDWLVLDSYALGLEWERLIRPLVSDLMVVDDFVDRQHCSDLLLNQNIIPASANNYSGKVPQNCRVITGPSYCLLDASYERLRKVTPPRHGKIKRIVLYFGGVDPTNQTKMVLQALLEGNFENLVVDVVLPSLGPFRADIQSFAKKLPFAKVHDELPTLANLFARADLAIGAAGSASWERVCLGLPALIVSISEDQRIVADGLEKNGLARWIGHQGSLTSFDILREIESTLQSDQLTEWSSHCRNRVDGAGSSRVAEIMMLSPASKLIAREARVDDNISGIDWFVPVEFAFGSRDWFWSKLRERDDSLIYLVEASPNLILGAVKCSYRPSGWYFDSTISSAAGQIFDAKKLIAAVVKAFWSDIHLPLKFSFGKPTRQPKIRIVSAKSSWINDYLPDFVVDLVSRDYPVEWTDSIDDASDLSDICFFLGYDKVVKKTCLDKSSVNLVVHESDLPKGRGWSPVTWQILEGKSEIVICLIEANEKVDAGRIFNKLTVNFEGCELVSEIRSKQYQGTVALIDMFLTRYPESLKQAVGQSGTATYYTRRVPSESKIDPYANLSSQFNIFRVSDNESYPVTFELEGKKFMLKIFQEEDGDC